MKIPSPFCGAYTATTNTASDFEHEAKIVIFKYYA